MWSRQHACCIYCRTTEYKHYGHGLCKKCYQLNWNTENFEHLQAYKREWYEASKSRVNYRYKSRKQKNGEYAAMLIDTANCAKCGSKENLQVHHIDHRGHNLHPRLRNNTADNIEILCAPCHGQLHGKIDGWARNHECCKGCNTTERRHQAKGYCTKCYYHYVEKMKV